MTYDVFISYARRDDSDGRVSSFVDALSRCHKVVTGEDLRVFFDRAEIRSGEDWHLRLVESLRGSASMVALLSPAYLASEYCWLEWTTFERRSAVAMAVDQGIRPLAVVPLPGLDAALDAPPPAWMAGRTPWRDLLDPLQRGVLDLSADRDLDALLDGLAEDSIRRRLADLTGGADIEDGFSGELVESVRWIRLLRDRRERAKSSSAHQVPSLRPGFVGRVAELRAMRRALAQGTEVAVSAEGVGGIGKTELSIAYAHAFAWDYPGGRWFLPCEGRTDLASTLALPMSEGLGVVLTPEQLAEPDGGFRHVVSHLRTLPDDRRKVLVILDNVDRDALVSADAVRGLGVDAQWFDLVATSRRRLRGGASDGTLRMVTVGMLEDRELLSLLGGAPDAPEAEKTAAGELLERTGRLTLAVEIAGAYLRRSGVSLSDYVSDTEDVLGVLSESLEEGAGSDVAHPVKYVDLLFRKSVESVGEPARMVLGYACRMHPDHVVLPWLEALCCREVPGLSERRLGRTGFARAVRELADASLLELPGGDGRVCRMHRLLGDTVRAMAGTDAAAAPAAECADCGSVGTHCGWCSASRDARLCALVDKVLGLDWHDAELRWQLEAVAAWLGARREDLGTAERCCAAGVHFCHLGMYGISEPLHRRALEARERTLGLEHSDTLSSLNRMANLLLAQGDLAGAEPLYRRALDARERILGPEHRDTLSSVNNLAIVLSAKGDHSGAEPLYLRALDTQERTLGPEHPDTLSSLSNLADLHAQKGDLSGAESLCRRALEARERILGPEHPDTLGSLFNLAIVLLAKGDHSGAEPLYLRALDTQERTLGPEHPDTLSSLNNLADLLRVKGDLAGAEPLYRRALEARERILGPEHLDTLGSLQGMATLLILSGDLASGEPMLRQVLEARERTLGPEHPNTLYSLNGLASLLRVKGDLAGAEPLYRRALEARERTLGPEHPDTLLSLNNLAKLLSDQGDLAGAEPLYRRALEAKERILGPEHDSTLHSLDGLAMLLWHAGNLSGAEPLLRRVLGAQERNLGPEHPDTLYSLNGMANLLMVKGDVSGAEPLYRRALEVRERTLGAEHPDTLWILGILANLLSDKGDLAGAETLYRRVLEAQKRTRGPKYWGTRKSAQTLEHLIETRKIVSAIQGRSKCERCRGTGFVALPDIVRLGMQSEWKPGPCRLCMDANP